MLTWFSKRLRSVSIMRRFWPQIAEHKKPMALVGGTALAGTALDLLRPWPMKWLADEAFRSSKDYVSPYSFIQVLVFCTALALVVPVGRAAVEYFGTIQRAIVGHAVTRSLRYRIFAHITELPLSFHARNKSGDLLMRLMGDVPMLRTMLVDSSVALITRLLLILSMLGVMLYNDAVLTLVAFSSVPLLLLVVRFFSKRISVAVHKQRKKEGAMADFLQEAVAGVTVIQALGRGPETVRKFARDNRRSARAGLKATRLSAGLSFSVESMLGLVLAATLGFGSWRVMHTDLSFGDLIVFMSYVRSLLKPIRAAARHSEKIAKGTACGDRILEILDAKVDIQSKPGAPPAPEQPETLEFDDVSFGYDKAKPVLRGFQACFQRGEVVGIFGQSGAGKSTAASLAVRLVDPQQGAVRLDGADLRDLDLNSLRSRFGLCMQETTLFGESVRENLLLGDPDAKDEQLQAALEDAAADGFVNEMEDGLDTVLDSSGGGLSGGQRRRLSLARTLLRKSPLLIVDEPFSGLDRVTVNRVRDSLLRAASQAIVLVVCHEQEHLGVFDRVLFVHDGQALDTGTHEELQARCAEYRAVLGQAPDLKPGALPT